jgi:hypothetical protein
MLGKLLNAVFGCWHLRCSFPITLRPGSFRRKATAITGTYVVCLECGKELPYDWNAMKIVSARRGEDKPGNVSGNEAGCVVRV